MIGYVLDECCPSQIYRCLRQWSGPFADNAVAPVCASAALPRLVRQVNIPAGVGRQNRTQYVSSKHFVIFGSLKPGKGSEALYNVLFLFYPFLLGSLHL